MVMGPERSNSPRVLAFFLGISASLREKREESGVGGSGAAGEGGGEGEK